MAGLVDGRRARVAAIASALAISIALALAGRESGSRASAGGGVALDQIGTFDAPVYVDNAPHRPKLLFVVEQTGTIRVLRKGHKLGKPFLDISDRVLYGGEQGLLSVAFDPKYRRNGRFFVYFTNRDGDNEVDSFKRRPHKATRARRKSRRKVIEFSHPGHENHNGGQLQFGPDDLLYTGTGDGGGAGDPANNAQDKGSLLGKLLRIKPKRKGGHRSPKSNPFVGEAGRDEIYSLGLRNPYRFSFDSKTDDILIGDVGQGTREEIDHTTLAGAKGANFGWDCREGSIAYTGPPGSPSPACSGISGLTDPIYDYPTHVGGTCAVIGGFVVRDSSLPSLTGRYLYSDNCAGFIHSLNPFASNPAATDADTGLDVASPGGFGEAARGRIYVTSLSGPVYRIVSG